MTHTMQNILAFALGEYVVVGFLLVLVLMRHLVRGK